jgi:DNA-binding SARP family transcriptional activator/tetratricopeptide (TPR) repeat protein/Mrp family chromosome partitioning ATPase
MEFGVLGPVEVWADGRPADAGHARQRAVLAVLLLDLGRAVPPEVLIDRVWGEDPPGSVRNVLYGYVARLRALVARGGDPGVSLSRRRGGYLLEAGRDRVDLGRFRRLVTEAAAAGDDRRARTALGQALALWRGAALAGLDSPWLNAMRATLELERSAAVLDLNDIRLRRGEHAALAGELAAQAAESPADERLAGQLMLALYRCGRPADALRRYEQARRHLAGELGAGPGPQLAALHRQILRADPALAMVPAPAGPPAARGAGTGPPGRRGGPVPRELPADVPAFTGRAAELAELDRLLLAESPADASHAAGPGGPADEAINAGRGCGVRSLGCDPDSHRSLRTGPGDAISRAPAAVISAVSGTAGVGKTALAVHWAHQAAAAGRFPDGQLHVNLRGYDPARPVTAADALDGFLRGLGVPGQDIPPDQDERAARYRSLLAGKRMLIVLDNANTAEQVRPLLPGTPGCAVLVTSRHALAGLVARDGAARLDLDLLPLEDAVSLLTELIGERAEADPGAAAQLARQCALLPLALRVAAELAAARPAVPLAGLAGELGGQQRRLDLLEAAGDPRTAVRAVFSWSYQQLAPDAARMFRLLGIHPGPDISVPAAASLAGVAEADARRLMHTLARAHLIAERVPGRYAFHDLLRAYAAEQAHRTDSDTDRHQATDRLLDHYLHTAARAARLLNPALEPVVLARPRPGTAAAQPGDRSRALAWFEAEHQSLLGALGLAAGSGFDSHAWQIPWAMTPFLQAAGHWQEKATTLRTALAAATRLGDAAAQALCCRLLANACTTLGDHDQARAHFATSLALYQRLGNRLGQAKVQHSLAFLAQRQGRYADALGHAEQALRLYQASGEKTNEAEALNDVGWYHGLLGDYQQARTFCRQAITLSAEAGHRWLEGHAWDSLGYAVHHLGNLAEAADCYQRALSIFRESGDRFNEAGTLTNLGDARHAAGEPAQAREAWRQALAILEDLQHPNAGQVRAKLASTNDRASGDVRS